MLRNCTTAHRPSPPPVRVDERDGDVSTVTLAPACGGVWNTTEMSIQPEELPLHLSRIETSQGTWLIAVSSVAEAQAGNTLLLKLILEHSIDSEHFRSRELGMQMFARKLHDPGWFTDVVSQIRRWIETTEGDGFLELSKNGQ
jgi:hypothetical protein